ncbi:hypothetical protein B6U99_07125 [Candidatus Geothermarchaeota archaeon ex4572_27]|nr:MAG: hypothetical protein B6U99_07125 [Candidatus Geothermarchaeota archaeon ex4572_27]
MRAALKRLRELIEERPLTIAILPTGYGKSRFFKYNVDLLHRMGKVVHVLPLRAIVSELASELRAELGLDVGHQAGIYVEGVDKTPFLASRYTVATLDSLLLNFYGIPVMEIWRSTWHSDVAFMLSRTSHIALDEVHLVVAPDGVERVDEELGKVLAVIRDLVKWSLRVGLKAVIFTATLYPWTFKYILPHEAYGKATILVYAPRGHSYVARLARVLEGSAEVEPIWVEDDDFYRNFKDYAEKVPTYLHYEDVRTTVGRLLTGLGDRVAVMFNSVRRCIEAYEELRRELEGLGYSVAIAHGQMTPYARRRSLEVLRRADKVALFSTQVIEAGVNMDFNTLITEVAPPHALIQRAGSKVPVNWRLPLSDPGKLDYLSLLAESAWEPQEALRGSISRVAGLLEFMASWRMRAREALRSLDEGLRGSFIRSSALTSIYLGPTGIKVSQGELSSIIDRFTITVSIDFIERHGREVLELEEVGGEPTTRVVLVVDDEHVEEVRGPSLRDLVRYPLYSLHKVIAGERRRYQEVEGEVPRILPLGLKASSKVSFNAEEGYMVWWSRGGGRG